MIIYTPQCSSQHINETLDSVMQVHMNKWQEAFPEDTGEPWIKARHATVIFRAGQPFVVIDQEFASISTVDLIMELENSIRAVLEEGFDEDIHIAVSSSTVLES